jgi:NTE family protein
MKRIGIAFGGGAARGIAHFGALRALRSRPQYLPSIAAGTSAGSIVAALYAAGMKQEKLEGLVREFDWFHHVISLSDTIRRVIDERQSGLVSNAKLGNTMNELLEGRSFDDLEIDLAVVATDLENRRRIIFTSRRVAERLSQKELTQFLPEPTDSLPGCATVVISDCKDIGMAVRASCAVPGVFMPVRIRGMRLLDGGLVDQVPVDVVRAMGANVTIGISLALAFIPQKFNSTPSVLSGMVGVLGVQQLRKSLDRADIGFQIRGIDRRSLIDPRQLDLLDIGERNMNEWLDAWESGKHPRKKLRLFE